MKLSRPERLKVAEKRIRLILGARTVANGRTLEQKIADAGPGPQRVDPHILTEARRNLISQGLLTRTLVDGTPWFHLSAADSTNVRQALASLLPIHKALNQQDFKVRMGQTLEIAAYRALVATAELATLGGYPDLNSHDDGTSYTKEEPPSLLSGRYSNGKLDYLVSTSSGHYAGLELKNVREWLYPDREEVRELLRKATELDVVPVLIARRIPYVTFRLLNTCGVILHQTYNQLFPTADAALAAQAAHKDLLGYHDIRVGNAPDRRLNEFIQTNLPKLIPRLRPAFDDYKDLLAAYGSGAIEYTEFAARVRRRAEGTNEDNDWPDDDTYP